MKLKRCCLSMVEISRGFCPGGLLVFLAAVCLVLLGSAGPVLAQGAAGEKKAEEKKKGPPAPEDLKLASTDGLQLTATFYPPETQSTDTVPVILLHMFKGDRKEYAGLATHLQQQGYAALVPDLRGHGDSAQSPLGSEKLDPTKTKLSRAEYSFMRYDDMEALRRFLVRKNDAQELNLNKLCIVGAEMGTTVAVYYAFHDWTTYRREAGRRPAPSQDLKALVLISPDWNFEGMPLNKPLRNPLVRSQISVMIVVGKETSSALSDARQVQKLLEPFHDPKITNQEGTLVFGELPTKLQGTKMLGVPGLNLEQAIKVFMDRRLVNQQYPWYRRTSEK